MWHMYMYSNCSNCVSVTIIEIASIFTLLVLLDRRFGPTSEWMKAAERGRSIELHIPVHNVVSTYYDSIQTTYQSGREAAPE